MRWIPISSGRLTRGTGEKWQIGRGLSERGRIRGVRLDTRTLIIEVKAVAVERLDRTAGERVGLGRTGTIVKGSVLVDARARRPPGTRVLVAGGEGGKLSKSDSVMLMKDGYYEMQ